MGNSALDKTNFAAVDLEIPGQQSGDRLVFDGSNWVRKEVAAFNASGSQGAITAGGGYIDVILSTERFDIGGNFASNTFTAPVTGLYQLNAMVTVRNLDITATQVFVQILAGGLGYNSEIDPRKFTGDIAFGFTFVVSVLADITAAGTAKVQIEQKGGATQMVVDYSRFSGFLVG